MIKIINFTLQPLIVIILGTMGADITGPLAEELMNCLAEVLVDVPIV